MLKQYLSLLLSKFYSKQESGEVAKQSYPSTAATTIQLTPSDGVTNKEMSYTPPSDGYIVLRDQGLPQRSSYLISGQYAEGVARGDNILFDFLMMTPVLKGVPVTIRYCGKDSVAQFIKNIGGGRKIIRLTLQGGVLCRLSHWYSSLRRSFLQARRSGYRTSETRIIQKVSPCLCLTKGTISSMSHHVMGCLSWRKAAQARCTLSATAETIGSTLIRNILTPIIKDYLCKLIRAKQYLIKPRPITEAASAVVNSSLLCQDLNKLEGGASC